MREFTQMSFKGLAIFFILLGLGGLGLRAQVLKELSGAVKTATEPAKDAQKAIKEVSKPAQEANKAISTAEKAPQTVEKEYDKIGTEAERSKKEYEKTADKLGMGGGKKGDKNGADSTATAASDSSSAKGKAADSKSAATVEHKSNVPADFVPEKKATPVAVVTKKAVDPMDVPRPVPPGSRDNKTASGPLPASEAAKPVVTGGTDGTDPAADGKSADNRMDPRGTADGADGRTDARVAAQPTTDARTDIAAATNPADNRVSQPTDPRLSASTDPANGAESSSTARYVDLKTTTRSGEKRPKPDYSHSPARVALEKADFDTETLEDLFRFSNWEGPEREHTVRAVAQALDELQQAIVEIKKLDPGQSTWRFEETYKDTKAAYIAEMKRGQ